MTALPAPAATEPRIGRLHRWKLTEPARFYLWPALLLLLAVLMPPAIAAGAWLALVLELPAVAIVALAGEAIRRSTIPPIGMARAALKLHR